MALISSPCIAIVVVMLLSTDAVPRVATATATASSSSSGRDGFPPTLSPRRSISSRLCLRGHPLSLLQFLPLVSDNKNVNNIGDGVDDDDDDDDALLLRYYYSKPPHDHRLYEILCVQPNATLNDIKKAWRRLSREYHPDKILPTEREEEEEQGDMVELARQKLSEITHAFEILSDDRTRLLYHRYGLVGGADAAIRLLRHASFSTDSASIYTTTISTATSGMNEEEELHRHRRLLELMGYSDVTPAQTSSRTTTCSEPPEQQQSVNQQQLHQSQQQQKRISYLTTTITERLRPIIEGTTSQETYTDNIYRECNSLKYSPLGAQILRCIGRAYLAEGHRSLRRQRRRKEGTMGSKPSFHHPHRHRRHRRHHHHLYKNTDSGLVEREMNKNALHQPEVMVETAIDMWCDAKQYALAAMASGRLVLMERKVKKLEEDRCRTGTDCTASNVTNDNELDLELKHNQKKKLHEALLSAHQMEALWKISKIDLYRTVRQACRKIVEEPQLMTTVAVIIGGDGHDARHHRRHRHKDEERSGNSCANFPSWGGHQLSTPVGHLSPSVDDWRQNHVLSPPPPPPPPHPSLHEHYHKHHVKNNGGLSGEVGRLRAAAAMILVGDVMVQCSKDGTAWNKK